MKELTDSRANLTQPPMPAPEPHGLEELRTYGEGFAGRAAELAALDSAWSEGTRVFVLHAEGAAGKTRVVAKWLTQMRDVGWRGAGRVFVHSFYSQGSAERRNASSELFFEQALSHFGHSGPRLTDPTEQGRTLARLVAEQHGLLVLDGLEPLQHPPSFDQGRLKDPAIRSFLLSLARGWIGEASGPNAGGLCVVTSRQLVDELKDKTGRGAIQQPLDRLDAVAGVELLRQLEVRGPDRELREAVADTKGHAYSLMLVGAYLRDATDDHEIRRRHEIPLLAEDEEHRYHARHLFGAYVRHLGEASPEIAVLHLLGFFDRPADERLLDMLREADGPELAIVMAPLRSLPEADWRRVLRRLSVLRLIDIAPSPSPPVDSHPLLRDYFADRLQTRFPGAWLAGHRRLFEHLCEATEYRPETLAGLQPLYQAMVHGCLAALHEKACDGVYVARILRGTQAGGFYSTRQLGALGADLAAVTCFFEKPWIRLESSLTPSSKRWLFNEAASRLAMLGRLCESGEPLRAALDITIEQHDWVNASICGYNLGETQLHLGEVVKAISTGMQAVTYGNRCNDRFYRAAPFVSLGDALHQAGRREEARHAFESAETTNGAFLPSIWGFRYCDLFLSEPERIAWLCLLAFSAGDHSDETYQRLAAVFGERGAQDVLATQLASCNAVTKRGQLELARQARNLAEAPIDVASVHLALARAAFYSELLTSVKKQALPTNVPEYSTHHIAEAIVGFRKSSQVLQLPCGLITRAWLLSLSGNETGCQEDLNEAWEIAERGPMPLFQADIQLTRARLFRDRAALAEARRLIEKHGYHRRAGELADSLAAARSWDLTPQPPLSSPLGEGAPALKAPTDRVLHETSSEDSMRDQVFISYSHRDKKLMEELQTQLRPYLRSGVVTAWSAKQISSGAQWFKEIRAALAKTSVAVLL